MPQPSFVVGQVAWQAQADGILRHHLQCHATRQRTLSLPATHCYCTSKAFYRRRFRRCCTSVVCLCRAPAPAPAHLAVRSHSQVHCLLLGVALTRLRWMWCRATGRQQGHQQGGWVPPPEMLDMVELVCGEALLSLLLCWLPVLFLFTPSSLLLLLLAPLP